MRRQAFSILVAGAVVAAALTAWPVLAQTPPSICQLAPVFLMMRDLIGRDRVGDCTSAVVRAATGDLNQPTTRGVFTFRPNDLVVAFSDGQTTFLYGPNGLESRPSGSQLPWEATASPIPAAASGTGLAPAVAASPTPNALSGLPIEIGGDDSTTTRPLDLTGGDYAVDWEIERQRGKTSCYVGARLRRFDDQGPGSLVLHTTLSSTRERSVSGTASMLGVAAGRYVFDVTTTGCDWRLTVRLP